MNSNMGKFTRKYLWPFVIYASKHFVRELEIEPRPCDNSDRK